MNCAEFRLLLHAHVDGELDAANSLEVERHLRTCAACVKEENSLRALRGALRDNDLRFRAPAALKQDIRLFVKELANERARGENRFQWIWKWLALTATAGAVLLLLLRPAGTSERDLLLDELVASHVRSLQVGHLTDVASTDQHTVKPWFDGKLDFAPTVKDYAAQGFPLIGGRLDYLGERNVAALVYRRNKHIINVFVWPGTGAQAFEAEKRRGFAIISGNAKGMHYCLVSDLNESELRQLAGLLGG